MYKLLIILFVLFIVNAFTFSEGGDTSHAALLHRMTVELKEAKAELANITAILERDELNKKLEKEDLDNKTMKTALHNKLIDIGSVAILWTTALVLIGVSLIYFAILILPFRRSLINAYKLIKELIHAKINVIQLNLKHKNKSIQLKAISTESTLLESNIKEICNVDSKDADEPDELVMLQQKISSLEHQIHSEKRKIINALCPVLFLLLFSLYGSFL